MRHNREDFPIGIAPDWQIQRVNRPLADTIDWAHVFFGIDESFYEVDCSSVKLAVLDTGVDTRHIDIQPTVARDFTGTDPGDAQGHGTWCCGYCCALPNGKGVLGLTANRKRGTTAQLYSYKMLGNDGFGRPHWTHAALEAAIDERVDVISASWGSGYPDPIMEKLIKHFIQQGGYFLAAAGNSGHGEHLGARPNEDYPARYPNVAGVAAIDSKGRLTDFSSYGPGVVCCAPGYEMLSTIPGGYGLMSGTSMATPAAASIAVRFLAKILAEGQPRPSQREMMNLIRETAKVRNGLRIINPPGLLATVKEQPKPPEVVEAFAFEKDLGTWFGYQWSLRGVKV